ncbi:molybdate ABC transporter substrate-binding protein [Mangrovimicrobium sediminis]|uniref:Molybdate ABC transporter substrate-binding protein n=1 Tax=Mangrovimicrobium sediminis TaxID=2562682 RepID=A0A4Z0M6I8_9GAMM|nr:molybdate ABC transporter substrate-binding protein [Haliea sp. SAOS-164]TGD75114.1 molybdate ABC transporter substrate-binding protein [Haliea sp. SAOS-164]
MRHPLAGLLAIFLACVSWSAGVAAGQVRAAVAANFTAPMREIAAAFEQQSGHRVVLSFGSSGKLFAQVVNGAPYDVFLSADTAKPDALLEAGLAVDGSRFTYAIGTLALWSPGAADPRARLRSGDYRRLAIANPRVAPYGAAALQVLVAEQVAAAAKPKLVSGENIAQTYQFVASGNADLGFVALSQVIDQGAAPADAWVVPAELHDPIAQDAVLLQRGADNAAARALLAFLDGKAAHEIVQRYGYGIRAH